MTLNQESRILSEIHETAQRLHAAELIDKRRMREYEALCNLSVTEMSPLEIKQLREIGHLSQAVFAAVLNISVSTVQKWEAGDKKPGGASLKLLNIVDRKGIDAVL